MFSFLISVTFLHALQTDNVTIHHCVRSVLGFAMFSVGICDVQYWDL